MSDKLKTPFFITAIVSFVFLFVLASAAEDENTVWTKYNNDIPGATNTTSTDGRIPKGTNLKGDDTHALYPAVIKESSTYKMWYSGNDGTRYRIYYATSPDGLIWTKYNNDIPGATNTTSTDGRIPLGKSGTGDETYAMSPSVIKDDSTYKMWYGGQDGGKYCIYLATCDQPPVACTIILMH